MNRTPVPDEFLTGPPATEPQQNFIASLIEERELPAEYKLSHLIEAYNEHSLLKSDASKLITDMQTLPRVYRGDRAAARTADLPDVPSGRYAVRDKDGVLKFYRIKRPKEGRWADWTFVDVQASDYFYPVKEIRAVRYILGEIARDPRKAATIYGREIGRCCICGRTLTNEVSRSYGIGPICAGRTNWFDQQELFDLKNAGE